MKNRIAAIVIILAWPFFALKANPVASVSFSDYAVTFKDLFSGSVEMKTSEKTHYFQKPAELKVSITLNRFSDYVMVFDDKRALLSFICWGKIPDDVLDTAKNAGIWSGQCLESSSVITGFRAHVLLYRPLSKQYYFPVYRVEEVSPLSYRQSSLKTYSLQSVPLAPFYKYSFEIYTIQGRKISFPGWDQLRKGAYIIRFNNRSYLYVQ